MQRKKIPIFVLTFVLLVGFAAAQIPTGKIVGKVKDDQGVALPGVSVVAESSKLVGQATAVTDDQGAYRLFSLPSGNYNVTFSLQGFKTTKRESIALSLEQTITLDLSMAQTSLNEEITVVGQSPLIDVKSTTKGSTMTKETFMALPRTRNFNGLLSTVPGVQIEGNQGGLSVDGASGAENVFYLDGANITNVHIGTQAQNLVMEGIEEVKVTASGYTAEFGGSMGGVVNVISRSGGNEFHGDIYALYNDASMLFQGRSRDLLRLNPYNTLIAEYANNDDIYFDGGKNRDINQRFEGVFNLGGFILKDKLWFFGMFNPVYNPITSHRFFTGDPVDLTKATHPGDTANDPRQGRTLYDFPTLNVNLNWQAKLTAQPIKGLRMSLSANSNYGYNRGETPVQAGTSSKNYPWNGDWENALIPNGQPGFSFPNMSGNLTMDYTVSNNFLISLRGGYNMTNTTNQQVKRAGTDYNFGYANTMFPEIPAADQHYSGWTNWAGTDSEIKKVLYERFSGNLDMTYYMNLAGEHAWKFGLQYVRIHEDRNQGWQYPVVTLNWGADKFYDMPDGSRVQGAYGWYVIQSDWKSPYGYSWNIHSDNWAIYLQDSWTIGDRLTLNVGVRTESEYLPAFTTDQTNAGWKQKAIEFGFDKKIAPRLGAIYDVFGDSSLKLFASYGVYYDVMKMYLAEGAFGGFKWWTSYYTLDNADWTKIAASGDLSNKADQAAGGTYKGSRNWRSTGFDMVDPGLKPVAQSEFSFGAEKKLTEELSLGARVVYKHLLQTIEDIGVLDQDADGNFSEVYYTGNPGYGYATPISQGGKLLDSYWPIPKAKREYWGLNLTLEKRFSNNWQGSINYTLSRLSGNYGGLASSDENGRVSPNAERFWDAWFERYDLTGAPLDGVLPSDRPHYIKALGSYSFPFGLTVGFTAYGRSGFPRQTTLTFNDMTMLAGGYGDLGRLPFTAWADAYVEYNLRIAKKYTVNLNATIQNITNTKTIQGYFSTPTRVMIRWTDAQLMSKSLDWHNEIATHTPDPRYGLWTAQFGTWTWTLGARFSF